MKLMTSVSLRGFARRAVSRAPGISPLKLVGLAFAWCAALLVGAVGATPERAWAQAAPVVTRILPAHGSAQGGDYVSIDGSGFTGATAVYFGSAPAIIQATGGDTHILVLAPPGAGVQHVTVVGPGGVSATHAGTAYTYHTNPMILEIDPSSGPTLGGEDMVIYGTNIGDATSVTFGGVSVPFSVVSNQQLYITTPPGTGTADVVVTTPNGVTTPDIWSQYTYKNLPFLDSIGPSSGPAGTSVGITGRNLSGVIAVKFGGVAATSFTVQSDTQIVAVAPPAAPGAWVEITLHTADGANPARAAADYYYPAGPSVHSLSPASGPTSGNASVQIRGSGLGDVTQVMFGTTAANSFTIIDSTLIIARSPAGSLGQVQVTVVSPSGTSATSPSTLFTYNTLPVVSSVSPASGPIAGGDTVVIGGGGFTNVTGVTFGGTAAASYTVDSDLRITAVTPAGSGTVPVVVTTSEGTSTSRNYTYYGPPVITGISPNSGVSGVVSISGSNFINPTVKFGATTATVVSSSAGFIQVSIPTGAAGETVDVTVTAVGGTSTPGPASRFTFSGVPIVSGLSLATALPGAAIQINGAYLDSATSVTFGGLAATISSKTANQIGVVVPAGVAGEVVDVVAHNADGASATSAATRFTFAGPPVISSLSPAQGGAGMTVQINGSNLNSPMTAVTFDGLPATLSTQTATMLSVTVPAGLTAENVDVVVHNVYGVSASSSASKFTHYRTPVVTSIAPATGPALGGTAVTINGSGFTPDSIVKFENQLAANVTFVSANQLTAISPTGEGTARVSVTTLGGQSAFTSSANFVYGPKLPTIQSISPATGSSNGGTIVTIVGTNFASGAIVSFGGKQALVSTTVSAAEIRAMTPTGGGVVDVQVVSDGHTTILSEGFTYQSIPPVIDRVTPPHGYTPGGDIIEIHGAGFSQATSVMVGDVSVPFMAVIPPSDTFLRFRTPPGQQAQVVDIRVASPAGMSATHAGTRFVYGATPILYTGGPLTSELQGGVSVTLSGWNFTGVTAVRFGSTPATSFEVVNDTTIVALAPPGPKGEVKITVESPTGNSTSTFDFNYKDPLVIETETLAPGMAGHPYRQFVKVSEQVVTTLIVESGELPVGLTIPTAQSDLHIIGTPKAAGSFPITLMLRNIDGREARRSYVLEIAAPTVTVSPTTLTNLVQGVAFNQTVAARGGVAPYTLAIAEGVLPAGLSFDPATGVISGTPTGFGAYSFAVTATDSTGGTGPFSARQLYEGEVEGIRPVAADRNATTDYGRAAVIDLTSSITGQTPTGVNIIVQPAHGALSVDGITVVYTPAAGYAGQDSFSYTANGGGKVSNVATVTIQVGQPIIAVNANLPSAAQAAVFVGSLSATGGAAPYTFSLKSGALAPGLVLASDGAITGTPTSSGSFAFTVKVVDTSTGLGGAAEATFTLTVGAPPPPVAEPKEVTVAITPNPNGGGSAEIDLSDVVQYASGIQIVRQPSHGTLTVDGFKVAYTPNPGYFGQDSFDYVAVPIANNPAAARMARAAAALPSATVTLTIAPPTLVFGQTTLPNGEEDVAYSQTLTAGGGTAPYSFAVTTGVLPAGLTLSSAGVLSGTPTVGGVFNFTVTATDSSIGTGPFTVAQAFTLSLKAAVPEVAPPIEVATIQGKEIVVDLTAGAVGGPFTGAAVVTLTPAGAGEAKIVEAGSGAARGYSLSFKSTGTFSGVATVTYTLSNASGPSAPGTVTITVEARPDPSQDPDVRGMVTAQTDAALRMAEVQIGNFGRRMESLHSGGSRRFQQGVTLGFGFADGGLIDPWTQREIDMDRSFDFRQDTMASAIDRNPTTGLVRPRGLTAGGGSGGGGSGVAGEGQVSIWTGGSIQFGRRDPKDGGPKFDLATAGLSMGADLRVNERLAVGVGGGFGQSSADVGSKGSRVEASNYFGVLYGSLQPIDGAFIDGMVGYGKLDFDTRRKVSAGVLTPTDVYATGSRSGDQLILSVSAGWDFRSGDLFISPYARVSSITGTLDPYSERGAGLGNLRFEDQDLSSLKIALGARGERTFKTDFGMLTPRFRFEYQRELKDSELATLSYDDWVGGPLFSVISDPFERDQWLIGIGGELRRKRSKFSLDYQGNLSSGRDFVSELSGQISLEF